VTDVIDNARKEITKRLKELTPLVDEFVRLEAAAEALAEAAGSAASGATSAVLATVTRRTKKGPGRPRGSSTRKRATTAAAASTPAAATPAQAERKRPGRPKGSGKKVGRPPAGGKKAGRSKAKAGSRKGSGTRAKQAVAFVEGQPGITITELAAKMGIKENYLYRVLPKLQQEGKVEKKGRGWHPKAA
jgi:hypothetical protein